jgi:XrtJ-associated TM-motif-TM protein
MAAWTPDWTDEMLFVARMEDAMNWKKMLLGVMFVLMAVLVSPLRAQAGCTDSPENATVVLALVGGAGFLMANLRATRGQKK